MSFESGLELRPPTSVRLITCIEVVSTRGRGTEDSPVRSVVQYWNEDGALLAERDSMPDKKVGP